MKICVSCKEPKEILAQADEIYVSSSEKHKIPDLARDYNAIIILECKDDIDVVEYKKLKTLAKDRFMVDLWSYEAPLYAILKENEIECFYHFPVLTFATFKELVSRGVNTIKIDRPLIFQVDKLSTFGVELRFDPTHTDYYKPNESGWVRPEDVKYYEPCCLMFDYNPDVPSKVTTLVKLYRSGSWLGRLNMLFEGVEQNAFGSMLPEDFGEVRSTCGQRCMNTPNSACHYCDLTLKLGDHKNKLKELVDKK